MRLNWFLLAVVIILYPLTHYGYVELQKEKQKDVVCFDQNPIENGSSLPILAAGFSKNNLVLNKSTFKTSSNNTHTSEINMGLGLFMPHYGDYPTLYFYDGTYLEKESIEQVPSDSVLFGIDQFGSPDIASAPPWLDPAHLKLDYGIMAFKVLGLSQNFVKVEVNKQTKQSSFLDIYNGTFMAWPEFLLTVNSVEFDANSDQKVFNKPLDFADEIKVEFYAMIPILLEDEWMYVSLVNMDYEEQRKGWIRWKKGNEWQIIYSLLS